MITPFSILDTRTKDWKRRKEELINRYGIKSELGRDNLESRSGFWEVDNYVSIFDPVLTENMMNWFCPKNGDILDPFAGGSVRGIIAEESGFNYTGIDLSEKQIESNREQSDKPNWIVGNAMDVIPTLEQQFDFVFTCPPYHDLEKYSDKPDDISNMSYDDFIYSLKTIFRQSYTKLKDNRFFVVVVSEIREVSKTGDYKIGKYKGFVPDVIKMCEELGLSFYNDLILFNSQHQASRTGKTYFNRNRKIPSVHQNVLVFVKGNPDLATEIIKFDGNYACTVNGVDYRSFRECAISIDPNKLVSSKVESLCRSRKSKWKDWQIFGEQTYPEIKYVVGDIPYEHPKQIAKTLGDLRKKTIQDCANRINSNNPKFRHWKRVKDYPQITYEEMFELQKGEIKMELPVIVCEEKEFYSISEAAEHYGVSDERIRQKLKSDKFEDFRYLY